MSAKTKKLTPDEKREAEEKKLGPPQFHRDSIRKIVIPDNMDWRSAAKHCSRRADEDEEIVPVVRDYHTLPWQGCHSLERVLQRDYSATARGASELSVPSAEGKTTIRWGDWQVAALGKVEQDFYNSKDEGPMFRVIVHVPFCDKDRATKLLDSVGDEIATRSLYAGAAVVLKPDEEGRLSINSAPPVVPVAKVLPHEVVLPKGEREALMSEVLGPIEHGEEMQRRGLPVRRGVLLAGRPGTGKTLSARMLTYAAIQKGFTVWYLGDARAMESALRIASTFEPALLIVEDIDRVMGGKRGHVTDRILNALDGLDRSARVLLVATTNDPDQLPSPLLRPGRLDTVLEFGPCDEGAAEELLRQFLGEYAPDDFNGSAKKCVGLLPASVREVATKAQLHAINRSVSGKIDPESVTLAAQTVWTQQNRLKSAEKRESTKAPDRTVELHHVDSERSYKTAGGVPAVSDDTDEGSEE